MSPNLILFSVLATLTILAALGVVISASAVRSAISLVAGFICLAVVYLTLAAEMVWITQVVVYAGAIMVLFLFVIMLLSHGAVEQLTEAKDLRRVVLPILGIGLAGIIGAQVFSGLLGLSNPLAPAGYGSPQAIGRLLFTQFAYPFEAISVLLLIGIVGSIVLAKRRLP